MGLGYIGLPTAAILANRGFNVHGVDVIPEVVKKTNSGEVHIVEPGLGSFVKSAVFSGKLLAASNPIEADIFMIAVPTPIDDKNIPDLSYVFDSVNMILPFLKNGNLIIIESTSPVGTTDQVKEMIINARPDLDSVHYAYCPERVLPGRTMKELIENDRIVGGDSTEAAEKAKQFYSTFVEGDILITNSKTAEMAKLVENSFRDINIAFANELSIICDKLNINVWELIRLANRHPRVNILRPGSGVGGHCIAIDPWFIVSSAKSDSKIIRMAREINNFKPVWVTNKIASLVSDYKERYHKEPVIACMGIAFKPNIDDLRESPSLQIVDTLLDQERELLVVEPNIEEHEKFELSDYNDAINKADILLFLVAHDEFKELSIPEGKTVLDICGIFE
ncbi:MAG: UDP-N-acetyl-D-mannosamine dehydrogenase [Bacteroidales bacterium]|nr:UDP-N-acetyl-D-mannosamine dehydrogenase [Bacteroidales bacterium]